MKKNPLNLTVFTLLLFAFLDMQTQLNAAEGNKSASQCGSCALKESLKEGNWQKAKEHAEEIVTTSPESPEAGDAYLWLGLYHKSHHDFPKSTKLYQKAEEMFPNTWVSAEATARIGCNYYKMNNFSKSLDYFRKAASEAKTWQQRKYASAWAKWLHFASAGKEKQLVANCATKSINYYLSSKGIKYDNKKLASSLTLKDGMVPLSEIMKFLKKENIKLKAVKCPLDKIKDLKLPVVAVVKPSHMIVIKDIGKKIAVYDPVLGDISYYKEELADIWAGKVLTISSPSFWKFASLSKKEMNNVLLGDCSCCPPTYPETDCDEDSEECCNRGEDGGGGTGSGIPGCPSCGGTTGPVSDRGFPRITVDTTTWALIVRDTPIGYTTALGEDVKVTLTFNSDRSYSGIFGNSWHSNIETRISENIDSSVIVRRVGGHEDTYTYSGGQYTPPVGNTNKLIKNGDGTFTLEFTKSHRKYHYDTHSNGGKILSIEDRNGNTVTFQYDGDDNLDSITDSVGRVTDIETDASGRIIGVTDPLEREAIFIYDANGDLTQVQDMAGNWFTYHYDLNHNIASVTEPTGVYTIQYGYDYYGIVVSSITNPGGYTYHYGGQVVTDPRGNSTIYYADYRDFWPYYGDTTMVMDALDNYVEYTYDDNRNRTHVRNKRNYTTIYEYDDNRNVTSKTDPLQHTWSYTYDLATNNLLTATDPRGKITIYEYDPQKVYNLLSVTEKAPDLTILSVISYTYNSNGLTETMTANGKTTVYDYDTGGNLILITSPEEIQTAFGYDDAIGRKTSMTNANGTTIYEYDDLDRITKITHPDSNYIQNTYNCCNLSQKRDENGKITIYDYDSLGRLIKVTDAEEHQTVYTYDSVGNLISLKDAKGNTTTYTYDALNRLSSITYPLCDSESYTYDEEGNMKTKRDSKGLFTGYTYDENNRLTQIRY